MRKLRTLLIVGVVVAVAAPPGAVTQEAAKRGEQNPLAPFDRLIGGEWHLGSSYQEFEWGLGMRSVKSRSYFVENGVPRLVSEGIWFWHPGEGEIRGIFTAVDMPVVFFDYTTRFEEDRMISGLRSFDASGTESAYVEIFDLAGQDRYEWRLMADTSEGRREVMSGTYTRRESR